MQDDLGPVAVLDGDGPEMRDEARAINAAERFTDKRLFSLLKPAPRFGANLVCAPTIAG